MGVRLCSHAIILKNILRRAVSRYLGIGRLDDLLKGPTPRSLTFVRGLMESGMLRQPLVAILIAPTYARLRKLFVTYIGIKVTQS